MNKAFFQSAKGFLLLVLCLFSFFVLTACQTTQGRYVESLTKDNGRTGSNEERGTVDSSSASMDCAENPQGWPTDYITSFPNWDGSVTINIGLTDLAYPSGSMPILRVTPYSFTVEDAKRVAETLFGDAVYFEKSSELTREEIEFEISRFEQSLTEEALYADYGPKEENIEIGRKARQARLDYYRSLYNSAESRQQCHWTFYPASYYLSGTDSISESEDKTLEINATVECSDNKVYSYQVCNREAEDLNKHRIYVYLESFLDSDMVREPTADDMENIRRKAETLLSETGLGPFMIDKICSVQYHEHGVKGYAVSVSAVPIYSGWPALHQTKVASTGFAGNSVYVPKYDPQQVSFHFTADGTLIDFKYESPYALVEVVEETPVIAWEEVRERIEECFRLAKEPFSVNVDVIINEIQFGLARVYLEGSITDFQLVPALHLRGHRVIYDEEGNIDYTAGRPKTRRSSTYDGPTFDEGYESDLLTISLIDGNVLVQNAFSARDIDN